MNTTANSYTSPGDKHSPPSFAILNDNLLVTLYDRKGRMLWISDSPTNGKDLIGKPVYEMVAEADRDSFKEAMSKCIVLSETVRITLREGVPPPSTPDLGPRDYQVTLLPMDLQGPGFCIVSSALPVNHQDIDEDDRKVLAMLAQDRTLKEIATEMHRSESTIDTRIKNLKTKLNRHNLAGLVAAAIRFRII